MLPIRTNYITFNAFFLFKKNDFRVHADANVLRFRVRGHTKTHTDTHRPNQSERRRSERDTDQISDQNYTEEKLKTRRRRRRTKRATKEERSALALCAVVMHCNASRRATQWALWPGPRHYTQVEDHSAGRHKTEIH